MNSEPLGEPIQILVADDHPVVRDGLVAILGTQPDFMVVGEASDGEEVVQQAVLLKPEVVLLDLEMPILDGVQALHELKSKVPHIKVIVFTAFDTDERILGAVQAGAKGYLLKGVPREELFNAIRIVHQGGSLLQPVVASKLLHQLSSGRGGPTVLTRREVEVLGLLAQGKPNKEIAEDLVISERTVKFHISALFRKLGAANRTEAVALAAQQGLIQL